MEKTWKKLFISILTWVFIFLTLGTSTFAWFSISESFSVSNLKINVVSSKTYLLIAPTDDVATNKAYSYESAAAFISGGDERKRVIPVYYGDGSVLGTGSSAVTTEVGKWYFASSSSMHSSNQNVINVTEVSDESLNLYVLTYMVYLSFSNESNSFTGKLQAKFELESGDKAVSVVVLMNTSEGTEKIKMNYFNKNAETVGDVTITNSDAYPITILAYIDGNGDHVYSDYYYAHGITGSFNISFNIVD